MKLTQKDLQTIRTALAASKVVGIELAVFNDHKIMGINDKKDAAIISNLPLSIPQEVKIGIGRLAEFEKRINLFSDAVEGELKVNDNNEVTLLTMSSGRSKMQFRCTAMSLLDRKYPKSISDVSHVVVELEKAEAQELSKAARTLSAENVVVKCGKAGEVRVECADSNNDQYNIVLNKNGEFVDDAEAVVFVYNADRLTSILDAVAREEDTVSLVIYKGGTLTADVKGHTIIIMPQAVGE